MSGSDRVNVQKDILDQVRKYFEKQREEAQKVGQSSEVKPELDSTKNVLEIEQDKPKKRYEPSSDFYKIFSSIIGGKSNEGIKPLVQRVQAPTKVEPEKVEKGNNPVEPTVFKSPSQDLSNADLVQKVNEGERSEPSIFERLGHGADAGAQDSESNIEFDEKIETGDKEPSIFERLSQGADVKEQDSEGTIESAEEVEKNEESAAPSTFERLAHGETEKGQSSEANVEPGEKKETGKKSEFSIFERLGKGSIENKRVSK